MLRFLHCRTPAAWLDRALEDTGALLLDHATLELKAAQQAQRLIWKYGAREEPRAGVRLPDAFRRRLVHRMSRLAREELRHFEQAVALLEARGAAYTAVPASRYAAGLHRSVRAEEPATLVDTLIVGAIIEARSCERFYSLLPGLEHDDPELARFYASLSKSEARHFEDYLSLAEDVCDQGIDERTETFLRCDEKLILSSDPQFRFHSGSPSPPGIDS